MSSLSLTSTLPLKLHSIQIQIPQLGFGVYQSPPSQCTQSCLTALSAGYRQIDTAQYYGNESAVGQALLDSELPRSSIFVTTKILGAGGSVSRSYQKCLDSIRKIDDRPEGYVDLFLIHSAAGSREKRREMWLALEQLYCEGKARAIGVSNWGIGHIEEMASYAETVPVPHVNQIELHPWCQQREIVSYCRRKQIVVQAYSPLARNYRANDETLVRIAKRYHGGGGHDDTTTNSKTKTPAQVLIRWSLQKGFIPLPKSDEPDRIRENADVFNDGFDITEEDMRALDELDQGEAGAVVQVVDNEYRYRA